MSPAQIAWLAIRPKTLGLSLAPVLVGANLAWAMGMPPQGLVFLATLCCALLIQIGTNLHNDAVDHEKGNDLPDRPGPLRVTSAGLVSARRVRQAAGACFGAAFLIGIYLASVGGLLIVAIGLASLLAAWAYSGGLRPIAYTPLGEGFVILFFGVFAVLGSAALQGWTPDWRGLLAGLAVGAPAAAVLLINNTRDRVADLRVGRRTLGGILSSQRGAQLYGCLLLLPFVLVLPLAAFGLPGAVLLLLVLPLAWRRFRRFVLVDRAEEFNQLLTETARSGLGQALLLSVGFWIGHS